jgi:hypothetical protein
VPRTIYKDLSTGPPMGQAMHCFLFHLGKAHFSFPSTMSRAKGHTRAPGLGQAVDLWWTGPSSSDKKKQKKEDYRRSAVLAVGLGKIVRWYWLWLWLNATRLQAKTLGKGEAILWLLPLRSGQPGQPGQGRTFFSNTRCD